MSGRGTIRYDSDRDRITRNVVVTETGCWEWRYPQKGNGYIRMCVRKKGVYAHRFSYETFVGPIPDGLQLDHLCRNPGCLNPEHLQPVTSAMNTHRAPCSVAAINAAKRRCPQGHPYDEANTYLTPNGSRGCRACRRDARRAFDARQRAS